MTVTITRETITPEIAAEMLGQQHLNRHLRSTLIKRYSDAMAAKEWEDNGETIKFNGDGTLIDGQHRLTGIRDNGLTMDLWVARGLTNTAQATIDTGSKRTVADVFAMRGYPNARAVSAALNVLNRYWLGQETNRNASMTVQAPKALELYAEHPDLQQSVRPGRKVSEERKALPPGLACALHYIFTLIDEDDAKEFFERLADGADLSKESPILVLRNLLEKLDKDQQRAGQRGDKVYIQAVIVKAWNAWRTGHSYKSGARSALRWQRVGKSAEAFPRPE